MMEYYHISMSKVALKCEKLLLQQSRKSQVGIVVKDIAIGAEDGRFDSRAGQIGHSRQRLANAATFLCCPGAKPWQWIPPLVTRFGVISRVYIMKINLIVFKSQNLRKFENHKHIVMGSFPWCAAAKLKR